MKKISLYLGLIVLSSCIMPKSVKTEKKEIHHIIIKEPLVIHSLLDSNGKCCIDNR